MTLKGILLDKDGTLVDFDATWGPAAYEVMRALADGNEAAFHELMQVSEYVESERRFLPTSPLVAGSSAHYGPLWAKVLGRNDGPHLHAEIDELFRVYGLMHLTPIARPSQVVEALRARDLRVGIATNDAESSALDQAEALGLSPLLDFVAGYDSGFGSKPGHGMVSGFAAACQIPVHQIALVGDSTHDLHAARSAGAVAIAVLTSPLRAAARPELEPLADYIIDSIVDLPDLIDSLRAEFLPIPPGSRIP